MTGIEYIRTVCPTTKAGKDPLKEDVMDAFEDGIAEGWKQCKEKQWKPSDEQLKSVRIAVNVLKDLNEHTDANNLSCLYNDLKKLKEG